MSDPNEGMTFIEEVRHVATARKVYHLAPVQDEVGDMVLMPAGYHVEHFTDPILDENGDEVRILSLAEGIEEIHALCLRKDLFNRPVWHEMQRPEIGSTKDQLLAYLEEYTTPTNSLLWCTYRNSQMDLCRVFVRVSMEEIFLRLCVGYNTGTPGAYHLYKKIFYHCGARYVRWFCHPESVPNRLAKVKQHGIGYLPGLDPRGYLIGHHDLTVQWEDDPPFPPIPVSDLPEKGTLST